MPPVARVEPLTTARALRGPFDYIRPDGVGVGSVLRVPFGHREITGVVVGVAEASELADDRLAHPVRVMDHRLSPEVVELAQWMAAEYCSTVARALALMSPPTGSKPKRAWWAERIGTEPDGRPLTDRQAELLATLPRFAGPDMAALRRLEGRGVAALSQRVVRRHVTHRPVGARRATPPPLTADQEAVVQDVECALHSGEHESLLLHGVTGSGKTEVYLRAAATALASGRTAIVLVPEIGLTPQIVTRFVQRFGDTVAVLHSKLSQGERHDEWARLAAGEARVCVGPRSAVFAPLPDLGLVVVDEEHDSSYKNEGDPRYDARHVAARRAEQAGAVLLAGSATPRPESVHALRRVRLPTRVDGQRLPRVQIVDMREARTALHPETSHALVDAPKSIVLLNRRGWSNFIDCRSCGHAWMCPSCDVALVLHRRGGYLACHHCGHREGVPERCTECGSVSVARHGAGTERMESDLAALGLTVLRLDADVGDPAAVLRRFEAAPRAVLVGTQMVAKGHDFPDVTLGVVVDADSTLRFPDFRAEERTFALVAQLAGRAGRGSAGGRVIVQTMAPEARSIVAAAAHDADGFLTAELGRREALRYPPFSTLVRIVCSAPEAAPAQAAIAAVQAGLEGLTVLGPAPLFRLRDRERVQLVIKATERASAVAVIDAAVRTAAPFHKGVSFSVDVDPQ